MVRRGKSLALDTKRNSTNGRGLGMSIFGGVILALLGIFCLLNGIAHFIVMIEDSKKKKADRWNEIHDQQDKAKEAEEEALVGKEGPKGEK